MNPELDGELAILCFTKNGELPSVVLAVNAKRVLQCAAKRPRDSQEVWTTGPDGAVIERIKIKNAPGGCVIIDVQGASTKLGASLVLALESLGAGHKVRIGEVKP